MTVENKFARIMRNTGPARFFVPVGIILIVIGIILIGLKTDNYAETTGKITSVIEVPSEEGEAQCYDVGLKFTVDGKEYTTTFNGISGSFKTGEDIKVFYDPADPNKTANSKMGSFIPVVLIAVGVIALAFGVYKTVAAFRKSKELDESVPGGGRFPSEGFEGFKTASGVTEYYFRFDGHSFKPGYIMEDAGRNVLYEGKMTKQALVGARQYEFSNRVTGATATHDVGHTVTQSYNDELFSAKSWFKFDGTNVWDVVHGKGIRIATDLRSQFPHCVYQIAKNGAPFALVETSSMYVHEEDEAQHKLAIPTGNMYYRIWTASDDIDSLFLTVFTISETEQTVVE